MMHKSKGHRAKDYLVTATIGNIEKKMVWNDSHPLSLDYPAGWTLAKVQDKICIFDKSLANVELMESKAFFVQDLESDQKMLLDLPPAYRGRVNRSLGLSLVPLTPLNAPYMQQDKESYDNPNVPRQLMMYHGIRYFLLKYRPVGPQLMAGIGGINTFNYVKTPAGYNVTAQQTIHYKIDGKRETLVAGASKAFTAQQFFSTVFSHQVYWWRFRAVQIADSMQPIEKDDDERDLIEQRRFENSATIVTGLLATLLVFMTFFKKQLDPPIITTTVTLQQPKVIPHRDIFKPKPPEPTPVPVVVQPKPEPPKPEPPKKVAKKEPPKKEPKIAKVKTPPKKVEKVAKMPAPPAKVDKPTVAKPPAMVKADTPPKTGVVVAKTVNPEAAQQAKALSALSFLTSNMKASAKGGVAYAEKTKEFMVSPTLGGGSKDSKVLDQMSSAAGDSNIKTKSSRNIASDVKFAGGKGKGLNDVQGRVSDKEIYGQGVGGLGVASGISMSGPGSLTEQQIESALAKYLSKFQFCYEKALITDSSLGGNLRLQWTIKASGSVGTAKVIQSQLNNESLHACVLGVLKTVPFPAPKGGEVIAKKTLTFKGSSL